MGRKKKGVSINYERFSDMSRPEKLTIIRDYEQLFNHELSCIPSRDIDIVGNEKAEIIAAKYFKSLGFEVYHSRTNDGYRCIGVEFYWQEFKDKLLSQDLELIDKLKHILSSAEFEELAIIVKDKSGTPDLLLIKDNKISFVEVKFNYETVKAPTIEFYVKYGHKWPISILRLLKK